MSRRSRFSAASPPPRRAKEPKLEPLAVRPTIAGKLLDVSETTARQLVKKGKLEGIRIGAQGEGPGDLRITVRSIRALINRE